MDRDAFLESGMDDCDPWLWEYDRPMIIFVSTSVDILEDRDPTLGHHSLRGETYQTASFLLPSHEDERYVEAHKRKL